jgi:hypothetical protein
MDAFDILLVVGSSKSMPSWNKQLQNYASNVIHFSGTYVYRYNFKNEEVTCLKKEWKGSIYNLVIT